MIPKGNVIWARQAGGTEAGCTTCCIQGTDAGLGVALDADANCYVTGYFPAVTHQLRSLEKRKA